MCSPKLSRSSSWPRSMRANTQRTRAGNFCQNSVRFAARRLAAGSLAKFLENGDWCHARTASCWMRHHAETICPTLASLSDLQRRCRENDFDDFSGGDAWMMHAMHDPMNSDLDVNDDEIHCMHGDEQRHQL